MFFNRESSQISQRNITLKQQCSYFLWGGGSAVGSDGTRVAELPEVAGKLSKPWRREHKQVSQPAELVMGELGKREQTHCCWEACWREVRGSSLA